MTRIWWLLGGMMTFHWAWLTLPQQLYSNIYTILVDPIEAVTLDDSVTVPWPVLLLLGAHSHKNRFPTCRSLSMKRAGEAARDLINRLKMEVALCEESR